jgi:hypothetical protein
MALTWFGGSREVGLAELIAQRKYAKAIELLRAQYQEGSRDPRLRLQLADVLAAAGRGREAVPIYLSLADELARDGFAGKAIAVFKKVQKLEPNRRDIDKRLAHLVKEKQTTSMRVVLPPVGGPEIGLEEIGIEPHPMSATGSERASAPAETPFTPPTAPPPTAPQDFEEEFLDVLAQTLKAEAGEGRTASGDAASRPARRVASPLFDDFTEEELLAVMGRLDLVSFDPGDIVISEGEPGNSLFVLTTGIVKAFVRNPAGRQVLVREMNEGAFFGEISILSGKPRTATITCATRCELLELDRPALDAITVQHPRVQSVLLDFYKQRQGSDAEQLVRGMTFGRAGRDSSS